MKMPPTQTETLSFSAQWTSRTALFSAGILFAGLMAHRLLGMSTPITLNLIKLSMAGALVSLVLALFAMVRIWRKAGPGVPRIVTGVLLSLALLSWPLSRYKAFTTLPQINDITTDWKNPPQFIQLVHLRPLEANPTRYRGEVVAKLQRKAYPDLVGLNVNRSSIEAFEVAVEALKRRGITIINEQVPGKTPDQPGLIEAYDRTLILGFYDDVAVRVSGNQTRSRIDVRSASRFGDHDLGQNARRVRALLKEIVARLEASVPSARDHNQKKKKSKATTPGKKGKRKTRRRR